MGSNLAKTPLMAVIYASLIQFIPVFLPLSESYTEALGEFAIPLSGYLVLMGYGLLLSVLLAVLFQSMGNRGFVTLAFAAVTLLGLQWLIPALEYAWYSDPSGILMGRDLLWLTLGRASCTLLLVVLAALLFPAKKEEPKKDGATYAVGKLGLLIKLLVLPLVFCILYLVFWYFLGWNSAVVREFYGAAENPGGFVAAIINLLLSDSSVLLYGLLRGLLTAVVMLPLLTRLIGGKRAVTVGLLTVMALTPALYRLIPTPLMPGDVRFQLFLRDGALLLLYGLLSSLLLQMSWVRREAPAKPRFEDDPPVRPGQRGITAQQGAQAVRTTMQGRR